MVGENTKPKLDYAYMSDLVKSTTLVPILIIGTPTRVDTTSLHIRLLTAVFDYGMIF